jgi:hypothetical protein
MKGTTMYKPLTPQELADAWERTRFHDVNVNFYVPRLLAEIADSRERIRNLERQVISSEGVSRAPLASS